MNTIDITDKYYTSQNVHVIMNPDTIADFIMAEIKKMERPVRASDLISRVVSVTKSSESTIRNEISKLKDRGLLVQPRYGSYDVGEEKKKLNSTVRYPSQETYNLKTHTPAVFEPDEMYRIPLVDIEVSAGDGVEVEYATITEVLWMPEVLIRREYGVEPSRVKEITVRGTSMYPTLQPGERIKVAMWQGEALRDGWIYVLSRMHFGLMIKRIKFGKDELWIVSDNVDEYPPYSVSLEEWNRDYTVWAYALEMSRKL